MIIRKDIYIVDYVRSAFTKAHPIKDVDLFKNTRGDEILAELIKYSIKKNKFKETTIEDLTVGCALGVKEQWSFGGKYPAYLANLADACTTRMVDQQCGSGIAAIKIAMQNIVIGNVDVACAGGYEHMSRVPMGLSLFEQGVLTVIPTNNLDSRFDINTILNMGKTAEILANNSSITRLEMDIFALNSHKKSYKATKNNFFTDEILAIEQNSKLVNEDANIRPQTTIEKLSDLKGAFSENGRVTAGNSSPLTTGAAMVILMPEEAISKNKVKKLAKIITIADIGTNPNLMGHGVIPAIKKTLNQANLSISDIDYWEINEAFSAVVLHAIKELNLDVKKVNINGGALAIGHPLGASGIRIVGTLARILKNKNAQYGLAVSYIGAWQGIAILIENTSYDNHT